MEFYSVLLAQQRVDATAMWAEQLEEAVQAVARREDAGDVSSYDRRRVERELHNAVSRVATETAAREVVWARLAPLIGAEESHESPWPRVTGVLLPDEELPSLEDLAAKLNQRADLRALTEKVRAAELSGRAAGRGWIPPITVGAGPKIVDADGSRDTGFVVTASIPLPVFDREQTEAARAAGEARAARGTLALRQAEASARLRAARHNVERLAEAARRFVSQSGDAPAQLIRSAEAAYRGGEIGVLELVDAYRTGLDDQLRRLELELQARRARIDLDLATGGGSDK
jgi:cobalt-zinc-cadmium efflux system outer membrane protein